MKTFIHTQSDLINQISTKLARKNETLSIAESCTGGFVSHAFTSKKRASDYFKGAIIAYDNEIKSQYLDIHQSVINQCGVVSKHVAELMATSIRKKFATDFGLATTGYVDVYFDGYKECSELYAWVAISGGDFVNSKVLFLNKQR